MRKKLITLYLSIIGVGFFYYVFTLLTNFAIPCIIYKYTGIQCPGCGVTRMFLSLIKFDFYNAFLYNPVVFILLIFWNLIAVILFIGKPKFINKPIFLWSSFVLSLLAMILFGIFRNLS